MERPLVQILVVVASIHMQHSEGRSGGGFLNNSSCLGVSRNLSARGNLGRPGKDPFVGATRRAGISHGATEKQVNIPALG